MKLGIYCRISKTKEEGKDRSIENQKSLGIKQAKELGLEYETYIDEGISGASDKIEERPSFEKLLKDISEGTITSVFAFDQSRFERNPQIRFVVNNLFKEHDISYYTYVDGEVDLHDPQAEFFGDIQSVINKYHVTMTKIKVKSVLKQRALEGKGHGIFPYGYTTDNDGYLIINKKEESIILEIFRLSLSGVGTRSIAEILNNKNIPTRYNKIGKGTLTVANKYTKKESTVNKKDIKWSGNTVRNIIVNPIYKGERWFSGTLCEVPAIFEPSYFNKVNDNLSNNRNNTGKKVVHRYLLKGLLRCGVCGRNMYGRTRVSKKDNYYMCSSKRIKNGGCENRSINIDKIENFIWYQLFAKKGFLERLKSEFSTNKKEINTLENEIAQIKALLKELKAEKQKAISFAVKGLITENELAEVTRKTNSLKKDYSIKLEELIKTLSNLKEGDDIIEKYQNNFVDFTNITSFTQKKRVINDFIENIVVEFVNDMFYEVSIEYKIDIPTEKWQTLNRTDPTFLHKTKNKKGEDIVIASTSPPMDNPTDKSNQEQFIKRMEDELAKQQKQKRKQPPH